MCVADVSIILAICAGLSVWLQAHPEIFAKAQFAGVGLLLWLAVRIWINRRNISKSPIIDQRNYCLGDSGFALCLSSPK
jgi:threonine/homoserine/homoserine lactone efflux protein